MVRSTIPVILYAAYFAGAAASDESLIVKVANANRWRDSQVQEVRSVRRYTLRNPHWKSDVTMNVNMIIDSDGKQRYEIISTTATGMQKQALQRILDGEVEAAGRKDASVNPDTYDATPQGRKTINGRSCEVFILQPKKKTKYTVEGQACIDVEDAAVVHLEGRTAKSVSFWVGRPYIVHDFRKIGQFWYSSQNRSTADVKFLGKTELTIEYLSYSITPKHGRVLLASLNGTP